MKKIIPIALLLISIADLFADFTYEGARSVVGAYLEVLGATALIAGFVSLGELLGYTMRFLSGYIASLKASAKTFWSLIYAGYVINLIVVPLLAIAWDYRIALTLAILERVGKGIRVPVRDYLVAEISKNIGLGKGFGIHEFFDRIGAIFGPAIVSSILFLFTGDYYLAFLFLSIPASISIISLYLTHLKVSDVKFYPIKPSLRLSLDSNLWIYTLAMSFLMFSLIPWSIVAYHAKFFLNIQDYIIALLYLVAMAADALSSIPLGIIYDRINLFIIIPFPFISFISTYLFFTMGSLLYLIFASICWGLVICFSEGVMRAIIAGMTSIENRAYAYGAFSLYIGIAVLIAGIIYGILYSVGFFFIILFSFITSLLSLILFIYLINKKSNNMPSRRNFVC